MSILPFAFKLESYKFLCIFLRFKRNVSKVTPLLANGLAGLLFENVKNIYCGSKTSIPTLVLSDSKCCTSNYLVFVSEFQGFKA